MELSLLYKSQLLLEEDNYNNTRKENRLMPKVAILLSILLVLFTVTNSYALSSGDMVFDENPSEQLEFKSDIIQLNSDLFSENNFKRYLIF